MPGGTAKRIRMGRKNRSSTRGCGGVFCFKDGCRPHARTNNLSNGSPLTSFLVQHITCQGQALITPKALICCVILDCFVAFAVKSHLDVAVTATVRGPLARICFSSTLAPMLSHHTSAKTSQQPFQTKGAHGAAGGLKLHISQYLPAHTWRPSMGPVWAHLDSTS